MRVLIERQQVEERIAALAREVARDYGDEPPLLVGVLNGAAQFMMELSARMPESFLEGLDYDFVDVSSYDGKQSRGRAEWLRECVVDVGGRDVLVVEGIVDTGITLDLVLARLAARRPRSLKVIALLDKAARRQRPVRIDYCGFRIEDVFVVGYGMDYEQHYRALRHIAVID